MDYKYLYLKLKIELMDNLDLTHEQWENTKDFIRMQENEQLNLSAVVKSKDMYTITKELQPIEKAKQLLQLFYNNQNSYSITELAYEAAKNSALICVNELLDTVPFINNTPTQVKKRIYYMDVREEIKNL